MHLQKYPSLCPFQSAYSKFHSTETTLLRIHNDLILASDRHEVSALVLLDVSAAFDTIYHQILLTRLATHFVFSATALCILESYLSNRFQFLNIDGQSYPPSKIITGVPQGFLFFHYVPLRLLVYSQIPMLNYSICMLMTLNFMFLFPALILLLVLQP